MTATTARRVHHNYREYLEALDVSTVKLEFCEGEIYAMAGGTPAHADLGASFTRLLGNALLGRCRVSSSDLKVRISATEPSTGLSTDLATFPDVTVVCGDRQTAPEDPNAVINPTLLVEVTSPSTEHYDRGEKLRHYKQLDSLRAVLIASHRQPLVSVIERTADGWSQTDYGAGQKLRVAALELELAVDDIYAGITLDP